MTKTWMASVGAAAAGAMAIAAGAVAQGEPGSGYRLPPQEIVDIVTRAPSPAVSVSPDGSTLLLLERESLPPVAELAKPMERLAGLRLDATTNDRHGPRSIVGLTVKDLASGDERVVALPAEADIAQTRWSPDGAHVAFTLTKADRVELWLLDVAAAEARALNAPAVNPIFGAASWTPDGDLLALTVPSDRGPKPERSLTPIGPAISDAAGGQTAQTRTFQDLLDDPHDEALFTWLATSQIMRVSLDPEIAPETLGAPGLFIDAQASPNGAYILTERLRPPFSYQVPWSRFPRVSEARDRTGMVTAILAETPLADDLPVQGVVTTPRSVQWHPTEPATALYARALDGGDPRTEADARDALVALAAPFSGAPVEIARLEDRYAGMIGLEGDDDLLVYDYDRDTRELRSQRIDLDPATPAIDLGVRNIQDAYGDPGDPLTVLTDAGLEVARVRDGRLFMSGLGATPEGYRPFLRTFDLDTQDTDELWRASGENYERIVDVVSDDGSSFVTAYEDPTTPTNFRLHENGEARFVTAFPDPHPELTGVTRELVTYERSDGTPLSAVLYLPPGHEEMGDLPLVVWAYPREFNDAGTAGQVRDTPYRFTRVGGYSHLFFLLQGYAVMDRAAMPVVGPDPETVNDTFIAQIVDAGEAAIDFAVQNANADPARVGVGGHSYGAFMTAHLLANSDVFAAGIARSGAYNRTLTPFGFQAERRIFWDAQDTYYELSPFMRANQIKEPILFIHGDADNNSGTFPQQSERMFAAVRGTGGTARLVMLPHESHGYRGRESVLHTLAEMIDWFETHVKNAGEAPEG